jgi:hypothetical protein
VNAASCMSNFKSEVALQLLKRSGQLALALLLLNGCAAPPGREGLATSTTDSAATFEVLALNEAHELIPSRAADRSLSASFEAIPGALMGPVLGDPVLLVPVRFGVSFDLRLTDLERSIAPLAQAENAAMHALGVIVQPTATRLARIGTFFHDPGLKRDVLGAGIFDSLSRENVMLVYFDRSCTVRGEMQALGKTVSISLNIPKAGLHWMRLTDTDATHQTLSDDAPKAGLWFASME